MAASKPGRRFLELGTGTGDGTAWIAADLLPQKSWPDGHEVNVPGFIAEMEKRRAFVSVKLAWAGGLMIAVRRSDE